MRPYIFSFKIGGVIVRAEPSWLFLALLIGWSLASGFFPAQLEGLESSTYVAMAALGVVGLTFSIIAHELSHTFVGRAYGLKINRITLFILGGAAELEEEPDQASVELVMAVAGPVMSLFLAFVFSQASNLEVFAEDMAPLKLVLSYLGLINLILAVFNMIPAFPLDGGRVFRALVWLINKDRLAATRLASRVGEGFAYAFMTAGGLIVVLSGSLAGLWWVFIGLFMRTAAKSSRFQLEARQALKSVRAVDLLTPESETAEAAMRVSDFIEQKLIRHHRDWFAIVDGGRLIGGAGLKEAQAIAVSKRGQTALGDIAIAPAPGEVMAGTDSADKVFMSMQRHHLARIYLVEGDRFVGVLSLADLVEYARMRNLFEQAKMN